jgi:hypothetical protein
MTDPEDTRTGRDTGPGAERPLGISLLIWLFWFWAGALGLLVLGLAVGEGPVMLAGRAVPRGEALIRVLPALVPMALAVVGAALALTLARPWGRPAALFPFALAAFGPALSGVGAVTALDLVAAVSVLVPILALLVWYLYRHPGPRAYFRRDGTEQPPVPM